MGARAHVMTAQGTMILQAKYPLVGRKLDCSIGNDANQGGAVDFRLNCIDRNEMKFDKCLEVCSNEDGSEFSDVLDSK